MVMAPDKLMTRSQVARQLGVSGEWVNQLAQRGKLAHIRTGYGRLFDPEDVKRFEAERTERMAAEHAARQKETLSR